MVYIFFVVASPALVVGMQDNEYTDAQVGDAGGLFKSLDPAPCGAVRAYLIQCSCSSLPDPVLRFQSTSSSASNPVYLIQCFRSSLPHSVLQLHPTSSSVPVPVSNSGLPHSVVQFQSTSSSIPVQKTSISCCLFLFLYIFFLSNFTFFE